MAKVRASSTGVPRAISPEDELSVPVLVDDPSLSRVRTISTPPYVTLQEMARDITLRRKQLERELAMAVARINALSDRVAELQETRSVHEVHITTLRDSLGEFESIAEFRETVVKRLAAGFGEDGKNGMHGNLKARFEQAESRKFAVIMFALGLLVTAGTAVFWAGSTVASLRAAVEHLQTTVSDMRGPVRHERPEPATLENQP